MKIFIHYVLNLLTPKYIWYTWAISGEKGIQPLRGGGGTFGTSKKICEIGPWIGKPCRGVQAMGKGAAGGGGRGCLRGFEREGAVVCQPLHQTSI